jgi:anthranilate phosphoribosyltransferase
MMPPCKSELFPFSESDHGSLISAGSAFEEVMYSINADHPVGRQMARYALTEVLTSDAECRDTQLGALLMGSTKVATPTLVAGFVDAIFDYENNGQALEKKDVKLQEDEVILGCAGSGKKGRKTINITTPSMVVAAAAGAKVLKAGSRALSSVTGSTDILESVGIVTPRSEEEATKVLHETNFGYYSIENLTPKFDRAYGNRFFAPHALSFVLPATLLPVKTDTILYGYAGPNVSLSASSFVELGYPSVLVCNNTSDGTHYIDEMSTRGITNLIGAIDGSIGQQLSFDAANYMGVQDQTAPGIETRTSVDGQREIFSGIIEGRFPGSVAENTICLNAATMLYLTKRAGNPKAGFALATEAIRSGDAAAKLAQLIDVTNDIVK